MRVIPLILALLLSTAVFAATLPPEQLKQYASDSKNWDKNPSLFVQAFREGYVTKEQAVQNLQYMTSADMWVAQDKDGKYVFEGMNLNQLPQDKVDVLRKAIGTAYGAEVIALPPASEAQINNGILTTKTATKGIDLKQFPKDHFFIEVKPDGKIAVIGGAFLVGPQSTFPVLEVGGDAAVTAEGANAKINGKEVQLPPPKIELDKEQGLPQVKTVQSDGHTIDSDVDNVIVLPDPFAINDKLPVRTESVDLMKEGGVDLDSLDRNNPAFWKARLTLLHHEDKATVEDSDGTKQNPTVVTTDGSDPKTSKWVGFNPFDQELRAQFRGAVSVLIERGEGLKENLAAAGKSFLGEIGDFSENLKGAAQKVLVHSGKGREGQIDWHKETDSFDVRVLPVPSEMTDDAEPLYAATLSLGPDGTNRFSVLTEVDAHNNIRGTIDPEETAFTDFRMRIGSNGKERYESLVKVLDKNNAQKADGTKITIVTNPTEAEKANPPSNTVVVKELTALPQKPRPAPEADAGEARATVGPDLRYKLVPIDNRGIELPAGSTAKADSYYVVDTQEKDPLRQRVDHFDSNQIINANEGVRQRNMLDMQSKGGTADIVVQLRPSKAVLSRGGQGEFIVIDEKSGELLGTFSSPRDAKNCKDKINNKEVVLCR